MIFLPINIENTHWYLDVINARKCKVQALDSLCILLGRKDLDATVSIT
jgi:Ulp1 family protease